LSATVPSYNYFLALINMFITSSIFILFILKKFVLSKQILIDFINLSKTYSSFFAGGSGGVLVH